MPRPRKPYHSKGIVFKRGNHKVIKEKQVIRLNAEESLRFAKTLLAPPRKLPEAFSEAMRLHDELVED